VGRPAVTGRVGVFGHPPLPGRVDRHERGRADVTADVGTAAPGEAAAALFQVITQRYLKSSTVLTTNLGIGSWGKIFDDPMVAAAMLDHLLHRSVVFNIDGESYRMRTHRARAERLTKGVKSNPNA
jgi:hypothetical protein